MRYSDIATRLNLNVSKPNDEDNTLAFITHYLQTFGQSSSEYYAEQALPYLPADLDINNIEWDIPFPNVRNHLFTFVDLFAGIGGTRIAFERLGGKCVFSSEIDFFAKQTYQYNFGVVPFGDITQIHESSVPDHDILVGGFPCQAFSIAGKRGSFDDTRGNLFFDIARIIREKRPKAFFLENVKGLLSHDKGKTLETILRVLREDLNYTVDYKVLRAADFGVPQNRERIYIVGFYNPLGGNDIPFHFPTPTKLATRVGSILEEEVDEKYTIPDRLYQGHLRRKEEHKKKGNGFGFSLFNEESLYTNTLSARYYKDGSEILIDQGSDRNPRKLTPRECARLQGFPEKFVIPVSDTQAYRQFGNSVAVPVAHATGQEIVQTLLENGALLVNESHGTNKGVYTTSKERIIDIFRAKVKGKYPDTSGANVNHDGKEGHWLEEQFGIKHNADNSPDILGYELKNQTNSKTTFGDWSANRYIFTDPVYSHLFIGKTKAKKQDIFLRIFGKPNPKKDGRYSWSGEPCPKIGYFNKFGQKLEITPERDIIAIYDFSRDDREDKFNVVPKEFQNGRVILAEWFGENLPSTEKEGKCLKSQLEDKFNDKGWFTCKKDSNGAYKEICFGDPINFDSWIKLVEKGIVFLDSGMYEGEHRRYSNWRSNNSLWDSLIVEIYE